MMRFCLDLDAASENVKIGWQKLQSTGRFKMAVLKKWSDWSRCRAKRRSNNFKKRILKIEIQVFESVCLIVWFLQTLTPLQLQTVTWFIECKNLSWNNASFTPCFDIYCGSVLKLAAISYYIFNLMYNKIFTCLSDKTIINIEIVLF